MRVKYSYLAQQFADVEPYFDDLRHLVKTGEFTLGPFVEEFERKFARYIGVKHAIGTNTGTDALILAMKAVGVKPGDEVITVPNSFIATTGAVVAVGARPVFVDCDERYQIDVSKIEAAITLRTRYFTGALGWVSCGYRSYPIYSWPAWGARRGGCLRGYWCQSEWSQCGNIRQGQRVQHASPQAFKRLGRWRCSRY